MGMLNGAFKGVSTEIFKKSMQSVILAVGPQCGPLSSTPWTSAAARMSFSAVSLLGLAAMVQRHKRLCKPMK